MRAVVGLGLGAVALHRTPTTGEWRALAAWRKRPRVVAVFGDDATSVDRAVLVVEGGPAAGDREASLLDLCRRLHAMPAVALRTPPDASWHPLPDELELVHGEVKHVGYWHDTARGGEEYLQAGARFLAGVSFDPTVFEDLVGLRDALPGGAPAVIECAPEHAAEAVALARGRFHA